jgi:uncharacterized protein (DUF849 family)
MESSSSPRRSQIRCHPENPHVPITPTEIVEAGVLQQAGAAVHVHAQPKTSPRPRTLRSSRIYQGRTSLIIRSPPAAGPAGYEQRSDRLALRPEMASLYRLGQLPGFGL